MILSHCRDRHRIQQYVYTSTRKCAICSMRRRYMYIYSNLSSYQNCSDYLMNQNKKGSYPSNISTILYHSKRIAVIFFFKFTNRLATSANCDLVTFQVSYIIFNCRFVFSCCEFSLLFCFCFSDINLKTNKRNNDDNDSHGNSVAQI